MTELKKDREMFKKIGCISAGITLLFYATTSSATLIDFEGLPDLEAVSGQYVSDGVTFNNAISLTAGFSLNEFDFPPSSGLVAIGDDFAPLGISFTNAASNISGYFTYASQLTFSAYDNVGNLIGGYVNAGFDNLGSSEFISLSFIDVSTLIIAGEWDGSFIMDDLNFEASASSVPEPSSLALLSIGLIGFMLRKKTNILRVHSV